MPRYRFAICATVVCFLFAAPVWAAAPEAKDSGEKKGDADWKFPEYGILPKAETGALRFLKEHPKYDGRGVVVAIFDTGVDPGAAGLQTTSDGRPKVIDIVDASGSGDVVTSTVRQSKDGQLKGLTGRQLTVDKKWKNPSGDYHLGMKRGFDLFPRSLVGRLRRERRQDWDQQQRVLVTKARRSLLAWDKKNDKPTAEQLKEREELKTRLELLEKMQSDYDDPGPIFDCVVFHDGKKWWAVVDTDEDGDLAEETRLSNYRDGRKYATFGEKDLLNFCVNIYDDGNLLSIAADITGHGTHVAGIVAANFPDDPVLCGLAPGAQIVSVKIGDTRLGSSSTGTGMVRGFKTVLDNKCDLINMSYGGATISPNQGRLIELVEEVVHKHNVIFVASAGNSGPALSTVGSPGGTSSAILGVGAYISPAMMEVMYSYGKETFAKVPEMAFHWSSRGPTTDGDLGVNLCAPGGAIAPVPPWSLQGWGLKNGTSMSSPNACGNIALLLSALKAEKTAYSPTRIHRALENTARPVAENDVFGVGRGLIQVDKAYQYVAQHAAAKGEDVRFQVAEQLTGGRGIYLRDPQETNRPQRAVVEVDPVFHEDVDNRDRVTFHLRVRLRCDASWVKTPEVMLLTHGGRTFAVEVDPSELEPGAHYTEVIGYDAQSPDRGPLFRVPVTVVRPHPSDESVSDEPYMWRGEAQLGPGQLRRLFIAVPLHATWAEVTLRTPQQKGSRVLMLHAAQRCPRQTVQDTGFRRFVRFHPQMEETIPCEVNGGHTLELCLAQFESSLPEGKVEIDVSFHGLQPDGHHLPLDGSLISHRVEVKSLLRRETLTPRATLKTRRQSVRPKKAVLRPLLPERDQLPDERHIHELVLTYEFQQEKDGDVRPTIALRAEEDTFAFFESQLWMLYDSNKRHLATSVRPEKVKLDKGKYFVRVHIRHDRPDQLEKMKQMPLLLDRPLSKAVALGIHKTAHDALTGRAKAGEQTLEVGETAVLYVAMPDKPPAEASAGELLLGSVAFSDDEPNSDDGQSPRYQITYVVPPAAAELDGDPEPVEEKDEAKPSKQQLAEAVRDVRVASLSKLHSENDRKLYNRLARRLLKKYPDHLPVLVDQMKRAEKSKDRCQHPADIVAAADRVIAQIDTDAMAKHYGVHFDDEDADAARQRKEWDKKKATLIDALTCKARAQLDHAEHKHAANDNGQADGDGDGTSEEAGGPVDGGSDKSKKQKQKRKGNKKGRGKEQMPVEERKEQTNDSPDTLREQFEQTYAELGKWADDSNEDRMQLQIRRHRHAGRNATALQLQNKLLEKPEAERKQFDARIELLDELGWKPWADYHRAQQILRFPPDFLPF